mmetsp:Transcript_38711/g.115042  ORF Transcript_38711/g.115042 Transcript_38711/m.115042 type:complete len:81 (+) Transcript_38711:1678-1920(+)
MDAAFGRSVLDAAFGVFGCGDFWIAAHDEVCSLTAHSVVHMHWARALLDNAWGIPTPSKPSMPASPSPRYQQKFKAGLGS